MGGYNAGQSARIIRLFPVEPSMHGKSLKDVLRHDFKLSRKLLAEVKFQGGALFVNQRQANVSDRVYTGDEVKVLFPSETVSPSIRITHEPLSIEYEDEWCLIIDKPTGLLTIPNETYENDSVAGRVVGYFQRCDHPATFHPVTRLDRQTSGLMLIAKDRYSHSLFMKQQEAGLIDKEYLAVIKPGFPWIAATVEAPIARNTDSIIERKIDPSGQKAKTRFARECHNNHGTFLRCKLETGRTHQIRVHLSYAGWPILGDGLYNSHTDQLKYKRTLLHACKLSWNQPMTNKRIEVQARIPADFPVQY